VSLSPVTQRTEVLDVLRGFAIFGMFTVNMTADALWNDTFGELEPWSAGFLTKLFINLFTNGKFVTIFSFLFGIGFYIQSQNCISNNVSVERFWLKRLSGLFIIGITAIALTLPAGILVDYAIFGLGLLLFHRVAPRYMLIVVILSFLIAKQSGVIFTIFWPVDAGAAAADPHDAIHDAIDLAAAAGGFLELSRLSLLHTWVSYSAFEYYIGELDIFGLMLLGVYVGRIGATADEQVRTSLARKTAPWLVTIGFAGILVWIAMEMFGLGKETLEHHEFIADVFAWPIGMPVLGLGYAACVVLLYNRDSWRRWLNIFAPIGRMALTNYLFTCFVGAFVGFQWGLGLYGKISLPAGLLIVVALLPVQAWLSRSWLAHFKFGPAEWLWRYWTYGQAPPMRRAK
jgi:uncharacterized protein